MRKEPLLLAFMCLLLSGAFRPLDAAAEREDEADVDGTDDTEAQTGINGQPGFCSLEAEVGLCRAAFTRFFYNHRARRCERFVFGGCGGNRNNFQTEAECQRACEAPDDSTQRPVSSRRRTAEENARVWDFSTPSWCLTGADRGQCSANVTRFYYDSAAGTCLTFSYSGCGGDENNFVSERACLKACKKAFFRRTPKRRLKKTEKGEHSVEIGYDVD